ncbi:MAG: hypothetical protein AAB296_07935, partial [Candidatus Desantisbacteria bacterium]
MYQSRDSKSGQGQALPLRQLMLASSFSSQFPISNFSLLLISNFQFQVANSCEKSQFMPTMS